MSEISESCSTGEHNSACLDQPQNQSCGCECHKEGNTPITYDVTKRGRVAIKQETI